MLKRFFLISATIFFGFSLSFAAPAPKSKSESKGNPQSIELNEKGVNAVTAQNFPLAEDLFKKALTEDPRNLTAAFNLAGTYIAQKKPQEAITLLTTYTEPDSKDAGIYTRLGDAYFSTHDLENAQKNYDKALRLAPKYSGLSAKMGTVALLRNKPKDAEKLFRTAADQDPKDFQVLSNLSSVYLANGKTQESIGTAKRALQIKTTPELYITLGTAYEIVKDYKNSLISFQRAEDLGNTSEEVKKKIEALKKMGV